MTDTPPPADNPEANNTAGAGCMTRIVRQFEFQCASCGDEYIGDPIMVNGCNLCSECRDAPLYTVEEIAKYIAGWTLGSFDEVRKLGQHVAHNALHQLRDDQDGIEACRKRNNSLPNVQAMASADTQTPPKETTL
jgi:hypothetical protein